MNEFVNSLNGKYLDWDGVYPNQCVDICKKWESYNGWPIISGNAISQPNNFDKNFYEWIPNSPTGVPSEGDLVIWGMKPYGHIAIFIEGNTSSFRSFDQNYPTGTPCHIQNHTYNNVIGWIHPKGDMNNNLTPDQARIVYQNALLREPENNDVLQGRDFNEMMGGVRAELNERFTTSSTQLNECNAKVSQAIDANEALGMLNTNLNANIATKEQQLEDSVDEYNDLGIKLDNCQRDLKACKSSTGGVVGASGWQAVVDWIKKLFKIK